MTSKSKNADLLWSAPCSIQLQNCSNFFIISTHFTFFEGFKWLNTVANELIGDLVKSLKIKGIRIFRETERKCSSFFIRLIITCSNILGGRFHRLPSLGNIVAEKRCWWDPRGYVPLVAGRVKESEKGRQGAVRRKASVGRGKAELFPLQGGSLRLNLQGRFFHSRVF